MSTQDAYCRKHFIGYCPELSSSCPYCENDRLSHLLERAYGHLDALADALRNESNRLARAESEVNRLKKFIHGDHGDG